MPNPQIIVRPDGSEIVAIHYCFKDKDGVMKLACMPHLNGLAETYGGLYVWMRTDDRRAVTCQHCKDMMPAEPGGSPE